MKRRSFIKLLFGVPGLALFGWNRPKTREELIAECINTPQGKRLLAQAMVEPLRTSLNYQSIGRRILKVELLPI